MKTKRWYKYTMISFTGVVAPMCVWASSRNHAKRLARRNTKSYQFVRFEFHGETEAIR